MGVYKKVGFQKTKSLLNIPEIQRTARERKTAANIMRTTVRMPRLKAAFSICIHLRYRENLEAVSEVLPTIWSVTLRGGDCEGPTLVQLLQFSL